LIWVNIFQMTDYGGPAAIGTPSTQVGGLNDDLQLWIVSVVQLLRGLVFLCEVQRESATSLDVQSNRLAAI